MHGTHLRNGTGANNNMLKRRWRTWHFCNHLCSRNRHVLSNRVSVMQYVNRLASRTYGACSSNVRGNGCENVLQLTRGLGIAKQYQVIRTSGGGGQVINVVSGVR